jgi:hypothetical protein
MLLFRVSKQHLRHLWDVWLIHASGLFRASEYLADNPDVARARVNPVWHYLRYGGFEGRDPGPDFSSRWYLDTYADVRAARINPLVHYLRYGKGEGRAPRGPEGPSQPEARGKAVLQRAARLQDTNETSSSPGITTKVFCIGFNKTGTTSMEAALKGLGYRVGVQRDAELLMDDWAIRDFRRIVAYCRTADAFQDVPFSVGFTYEVLDYAFPGSKFILTVRNDADEWYRSYMRFTKKLLGGKDTPTVDQLKAFPYVSVGWAWRQEQNIFGIDEENVFDETIYTAHYTNHNVQVIEYFRLRPRDLLMLNLADPSSMRSLCEFLGIEYAGQTMPHLNRSET